MARHLQWAASAAAALSIVALPASATGQRAGATVKAARADFADMAKGNYFGDVISDARGSSRSGVRIVVARTGPNQVRVTSDYGRLPAFEVRLTRAMDTIQNADGDAVFLLDLKSPRSLMVTVDEASWAGVKE